MQKTRRIPVLPSQLIRRLLYRFSCDFFPCSPKKGHFDSGLRSAVNTSSASLTVIRTVPSCSDSLLAFLLLSTAMLLQFPYNSSGRTQRQKVSTSPSLSLQFVRAPGVKRGERAYDKIHYLLHRSAKELPYNSGCSVIKPACGSPRSKHPLSSMRYRNAARQSVSFPRWPLENLPSSDILAFTSHLFTICYG
jgi:hypothetical protein